MILNLLFGGAGVGSGRAGASCCAGVRCCFVALPSAMSSASCLFEGDGIAGLLRQLVGAVAIGELANAGAVDASGVSAIGDCSWWKLWFTCW